MSKVLVLYTGGTIGMIKDPESGHLGSVDFNSVYEHIPELNRLQKKQHLWDGIHFAVQSPV